MVATFFFPRQNAETGISDSSDTEDTERLGEKLFLLVEGLDPVHATDITGSIQQQCQQCDVYSELMLPQVKVQISL